MDFKACKSKFQIVSDQYCCQSQNAGESTHQFVNLVIASTMSGRSSLLYNHIEIYNAIKLQWVEDGRTYIKRCWIIQCAQFLWVPWNIGSNFTKSDAPYAHTTYLHKLCRANFWSQSLITLDIWFGSLQIA